MMATVEVLRSHGHHFSDICNESIIEASPLPYVFSRVCMPRQPGNLTRFPCTPSQQASTLPP